MSDQDTIRELLIAMRAIKDIVKGPMPWERKEVVLRRIEILDLVNAAVAKVGSPS